MTTAFALATAFVVSRLVVLLVERHAATLGLLDIPNERSSHRRPTPRGGGLGVVAGVLAGIGAAAATSAMSADVFLVCALTLLVALVGLWDDVRQIGVAPRLVSQALAAALLIWVFGPIPRLPLPPPADLALGVLSVPFSLVWIVALVNFFNFMDGADGLAAGQAALTLLFLAWALTPHDAAVLAAVAATATFAFLIRNWPPAHVFLGDVGSSVLGFLLAALPFLATPAERPQLISLVTVSLALFLFDPAMTLVRRTFRGKPIGVAHRDHAYQRLFTTDESHTVVVRWLLGAGLLLTLAAAAAYEEASLGWVAIATAAVVFLVEWVVAARRTKDRS